MTSSLIIWLVFSLQSTLLAFAAGCLVEGWFKSTIGREEKMALRIGSPLVGGFVGMFGWMFWAIGTRYPEHVPTSDIFSIGLIGPLWGILYTALGCVALWGVYKVMTNVGNILSGISAGVRGLFTRRKKVGKPATQAAQQTAQPVAQPVSLSQLSDKFASLQTLCQSLRQQLKEGPSFEHLGTIMDELKKVRSALDDDNKKSVVPVLMSDYIIPIEQGMRAYERLLKRSVSSADAMLSEMHEKTLPLMVEKMQSIYAQIHVGDIAELSTVASKLEVARPLKVQVEAEAEAAAEAV